MTQLLSDDELIKEIDMLMFQPFNEVIYPETEVENGFEVANRLLILIKSQQQAYADEIIGSMDNELEYGKVVINGIRNSLRLELRTRNRKDIEG